MTSSSRYIIAHEANHAHDIL